MAVPSGPAGPVLAGPVFDIADFKIAHARTINNKAKNYRLPAQEKTGLFELRNIDYPKSSPRSLRIATVDREIFASFVFVPLNFIAVTR